MTWTSIVIWLSLAISTRTPSACYTQVAEQFAVSAAIGEAYGDAQLAHEMIMGAIVEKSCDHDAQFIASYRAALRGDPFHWRAFFAPWLFAPARVEALHGLWQTTLIQHYDIRHFDNKDAPRYSWWDSRQACPRGDIVVGEHRFC